MTTLDISYHGLVVTCDIDEPTGYPGHGCGGPDIGSVHVRSAVVADPIEYESYFDAVCAEEGQIITETTFLEDEDGLRREAWDALGEYA